MGFAAPVTSGSSPSYGTLLSTPSGTNTYGDWTWIANAPSVPVSGFCLAVVNPFFAGASRHVVQLGHATSGSTQLILDKLMTQSARGTDNGVVLYLPLYLPTSGSIMGRASCTKATSSVLVSIVPFPLGMLSPMVFYDSQSYGFGAGDSAAATSVDPGITLNKKGSWAQLHPALPNPIRYMVIMVGGLDNSAMATAMWRLDIGVGGAGAEVTVVPDLVISANTTSDIPEPFVITREVYIPAGVRLSARLQCSINDATDRLLDVAVLGLF